MSSNGFLLTLELPPPEARAAIACNALTTVPALLGLWLADVPSPGRLAGLAALCGWVAWTILRGACGHHRLRRAVLWPDGSWQLDCGTGWQPARLAWGWGHNAGPLVTLRWRNADGREVGGCWWRRRADATLWRRLRVRLRLA